MNNNSEFSTLSKAIKVSLWTGCFLFSAICIFCIFDSSLFTYDICLDTKCIKYFFNAFSIVPTFVDFFLKIFLAVFAVFGTVYALKNYLNSTTTSRLNVHLLHLNTFKDYIISEVSKEPRLNGKSIDILKWYNLAFPKSRDGSLSVGDGYSLKVQFLIKVINESNNIYQGNNLEAFAYTTHQTRIKDCLIAIGIKIDRMPKKDFHDVENEVFKLLNKVNKEMCNVGKDLIVPMTKYR